MFLLILCLSIFTQLFAADTTLESIKKKYLWGSDTNKGRREDNEDADIIVQSYYQSIFGVLDGHINIEAVKKICRELTIISEKESVHDEESIKNIFARINSTLKNTIENNLGNNKKAHNFTGGATASLFFSLLSGEFCAQVGDSEIIDSSGNLILATHTFENEGEKNRIEAILVPREDDMYPQVSLKHCLRGITRAFGDHEFIAKGFSQEPDIKKINLMLNDFLVFATDGITNHLSRSFIAEHVKEQISKERDLDTIAKQLIILASYKADANNIIEADFNKTKENLTEMTYDDLRKNTALKKILDRAPDNQTVVIVHRKA